MVSRIILLVVFVAGTWFARYDLVSGQSGAPEQQIMAALWLVCYLPACVIAAAPAFIFAPQLPKHRDKRARSWRATLAIAPAILVALPAVLLAILGWGFSILAVLLICATAIIVTIVEWQRRIVRDAPD